MNLYIRADGAIKADDTLIGYVGETNHRKITVVQAPIVENAEYRLYFDIGNTNPYEVALVDGEYTVDGSVLASEGEITVQWAALVPEGEAYIEVAKSAKLSLHVGASIDGTPEAVPTYEQTLDLLDQLNNGADGMSAYASAQAGGYTDTEANFYADLAAMQGLAEELEALL